MHKHPKITEKRIMKALERIQEHVYGPTHPVELAAWAVGGEPVPPAEAFAQEYTPFEVGQPWGKVWDTVWFRLRGEVPADWAGKEVVTLMRLTDTGGEGFTAEGLIYSEGKVVRALNINRSEIEISQSAKGGERFEFFVEAAANIADAAGKLVTTFGEPLFKIVQAELACFNRDVAELYYDFRIASDAMQHLPEDSQRRAELRTALNETVNTLDLNDRSTIGPARECLSGELAKKNGSTVHKVSAIGHAHIDTAWLWPLRETIRKCARTFSTAVDYMERYPEYVFGCSQAQQYDWMKALYPEVYAKMREHIKSGQWELIGSMWIEVDCNLASGESLIRQILYGKRYFEEEFGYETRDVWIPDVFGYSASLPQIFEGCGVDYFVTQKISWSQLNKFPHHTFYWEGIDGTRVFTHFPPVDTYNALMTPKELLYNVSNFKEHGRSDRSLYIYGYGDGGGGPSIAMLEQARRLADFEGLPQVKQEKVLDFLRVAKAEAKDLPVWVGELYLELHRGTYTTQGRTKRGNRVSEFLLRDAEFFDAVSLIASPDRKESAANPPRAVYDVTGLDKDASRHQAALERGWKLVLLNQFHDIIPGSSIGWVYEDNARDYETVRTLGESVVASSLSALDRQIGTEGLKSPVRVFNTLGFARKEVIDLPDGGLSLVEAPSLGYAVIDAARPDISVSAPVRLEEKDGEFVIENGLLRVVVAANGTLKSVLDLAAGREVLAPGQSGNVFHLHRDEPNMWDAWDVEIFYKEQHTELTDAATVEGVETHPLRVTLKVTRSFGHSKIVQKIVLSAESRRIDFVTEVDWRERNKFLKVAFPVDVRSPRATYEIQYGHIERPTHYNTTWDLARFEVCAQKWADLSEAGYGVALLNDCKYGHDIHENVIRLSLLRAPTAPDPEADQGRHIFTYSLYPHSGTFQESGVIEAAYALNVPLRADKLAAGQTGALEKSHSWIKVDRPGVYAEAIKNAEDGNGVIVRLYEGYGSRGPCKVELGWPAGKVSRTNMLEKDAEPLAIQGNAVSLDLKPFEIVTLRVK